MINFYFWSTEVSLQGQSSFSSFSSPLLFILPWKEGIYVISFSTMVKFRALFQLCKGKISFIGCICTEVLPL